MSFIPVLVNEYSSNGYYDCMSNSISCGVSDGVSDGMSDEMSDGMSNTSRVRGPNGFGN